MESTINGPIESAAAALATAAASLMTATGEETLTLVCDLVRIAHSLGELTAAARDRWAAWGTVTPHLQQAEALAAEATRCLSHAVGTYVFNSTRSDPIIVLLAGTGTPPRSAPAKPKHVECSTPSLILTSKPPTTY